MGLWGCYWNRHKKETTTRQQQLWAYEVAPAALGWRNLKIPNWKNILSDWKNDKITIQQLPDDCKYVFLWTKVKMMDNNKASRSLTQLLKKIQTLPEFMNKILNPNFAYAARISPGAGVFRPARRCFSTKLQAGWKDQFRRCRVRRRRWRWPRRWRQFKSSSDRTEIPWHRDSVLTM